MQIQVTYRVIDEKRAGKAAMEIASRQDVEGYNLNRIEDIGKLIVCNLDVLTRVLGSYELADIGLELVSLNTRN